MRRFVSVWGMLALVVFLVGCDHGTKFLAAEKLRGQAPVELLHDILDLRYTENRDVAFSLLRGMSESVKKPLIYLNGLAALGLVVYMWRRHRDARIAERLGLALILGGAIGNLSDRLVHGYVVDFVYLHHWPVFNAADAWLVMGGGLLILMQWRSGRAPEPVPAPAAAPAPVEPPAPR